MKSTFCMELCKIYHWIRSAAYSLPSRKIRQKCWATKMVDTCDSKTFCGNAIDMQEHRYPQCPEPWIFSIHVSKQCYQHQRAPFSLSPGSPLLISNYTFCLFLHCTQNHTQWSLWCLKSVIWPCLWNWAVFILCFTALWAETYHLGPLTLLLTCLQTALAFEFYTVNIPEHVLWRTCTSISARMGVKTIHMFGWQCRPPKQFYQRATPAAAQAACCLHSCQTMTLSHASDSNHFRGWVSTTRYF